MSYQSIHAQAQFDSWSRRYDWDPLQLLFFRPAHRMLLEALGPEDRRVLDIGCGTGQFAAQVLECYPRTHVWGLDLSAGMLSRGQARREASEGHLHLVQGDSQRLPFADDTFDVITMVSAVEIVLHHLGYPLEWGTGVRAAQEVLATSIQ